MFAEQIQYKMGQFKKCHFPGARKPDDIISTIFPYLFYIIIGDLIINFSVISALEFRT